MRRFGRAVIVLVVASALPWLVAARAAACWCLPPPGATILWPAEGARDVEPDTAIVLWRQYSQNDRSAVTISLAKVDGEALELEETRYFEGWLHCEGETAFFLPKQPLLPGCRYVVTVQVDREPVEKQSVMFTVGDTPKKVRPELTPEVTYLSVGADPAHELCRGRSCVDLAEVRVDLGQVPETPVWLFVGGQLAPYQHNQFSFGPVPSLDVPEDEPDPRRVRQIAVHAPSEEPCVDIALYGSDGRAVFEERRCRPDRCVVYGMRSSSLCDHPLSSGVDASRISDESCDDPPHLLETGIGELIYPPIQAKAAAVERRPRSHGCSMLPLTAAPAGVWQLALAVCAWTMTRRRARRPRET